LLVEKTSSGNGARGACLNGRKRKQGTRKREEVVEDNTGKQQNSSKKNSNINHPSLKNKRFFLLPPCTGPLDGKMENTAYGGPTVPLMSKEQMFLNQRFAQPKKKKSKTTKVNDPIQHQSSQNYLSSSSTFLPPKNNNR
jgi:hypothetical protein